jgi:hypothetical protein
VNRLTGLGHFVDTGSAPDAMRKPGKKDKGSFNGIDNLVGEYLDISKEEQVICG